jgi:hypothetical protein
MLIVTSGYEEATGNEWLCVSLGAGSDITVMMPSKL